METITREAALIIKHLHEDLSDDETIELQSVINRSVEYKLLVERLSDPVYIGRELNAMYQYNKKAGWKELKQLLADEGIIYNRYGKAWPYIAAATIIIMITAGFFWHTSRQSKTVDTAQTGQIKPETILPSGKNPILTLQNGSTIELVNGVKRIIPAEGTVTINWNGLNELRYIDHHIQPGQLPEYQQPIPAIIINTIATPKNKALQLYLADGSHIQLDPATAINYPANTAGKERIVNLFTGFASFKVDHDETKPFHVQFGDIVITDIGTSFTVSVLPNEQKIKTELTEGSIKIKNLQESKVMKPGQQALAGNEGPISVTDMPKKRNNTESLRFNKDDFITTIKKLESWYNVKVVYTQIPTGRFTAHINHNVPLIDIIPSLEIVFQVTIKVEGNTIIFLPKK